MSKDALRRLFGYVIVLSVSQLPLSTVHAAGRRTANFIVSAPSADLAREVAQAAERFRRDLAREWLGHELPNWAQPCPIRVESARDMPAGGETSFMFDGGYPSQWQMLVRGSRERILDSVLPHEVTHTIFATHFGQPLPRWADEGACTTVEHESERRKQHNLLIEFLSTERGIPFRQMFAMRDYPRDILPLYSQGYSLARYLIAQGGKPKFIRYVEDGMATHDWHGSTARHYGFRNLGELQVSWLDWVQQGSPSNVEPRPGGTPAPAATLASFEMQRSLPSSPAPQAVASIAGTGQESESWYIQQQRRLRRDIPSDLGSDHSAAPGAAVPTTDAPATAVPARALTEPIRPIPAPKIDAPPRRIGDATLWR